MFLAGERLRDQCVFSHVIFACLHSLALSVPPVRVCRFFTPHIAMCWGASWDDSPPHTAASCCGPSVDMFAVRTSQSSDGSVLGRVLDVAWHAHFWFFFVWFPVGVEGGCIYVPVNMFFLLCLRVWLGDALGGLDLVLNLRGRSSLSPARSGPSTRIKA